MKQDKAQEKPSPKRKKARGASRPLFKGKKPESPSRSVKETKKESTSSFKEKKSVSGLKKNIAALEAQLAEVKKDYLYLKADFENYKKNVLKEKSDLIHYGGQRLVSSLADEVLDDFERAFQSSSGNQSLENFKEGISLIYSKFHKVLKNFGVTVIDPTGQPFDPQCHEALSRQKSNEVPEGHVIMVIKKAYKLHDRLIRPAQVVVSEGKLEKKSEEAPAEESTEENSAENESTLSSQTPSETK